MTIEDADTGAEQSQRHDSSVDARLNPQAASSTTSSPLHIPIWQETLILLVIAVVLAVVLKAFFVQAFYIPSESMEPGLVKNDRILVQKVSYWGGDSPQRGDVVVFQDPGGWLGSEDVQGPANAVTKGLEKIGLFPSGGHLVKRVVGVAGDTIVCCDEQGRLSINGEVVDESDDTRPLKVGESDCYGPMTGNCDWSVGPVPAGSVFVMGDNRGHSADSTVHMCLEGETECTKNPYVDLDLIVGKVFALVWPLGHFGGVDGSDAYGKVPTAN